MKQAQIRSIDEMLKSGQYAVVNSTLVPALGHPQSIDAFQKSINSSASVLSKITPGHSEAMTVIETSSPIIIKKIVKTQVPGDALPESINRPSNSDMAAVATAHHSSNGDRSQAAKGSVQSASSLSLDESPMAHAESIALAMRAPAIKAIDIGNDLASRAEQEHLPLEKLPYLLLNSPYPKMTRYVYEFARRHSKTRIDFMEATRDIGGEMIIPEALQSENVFCLRGAHLTAPKNLKDKSWILVGNNEDPEWRRLGQMFPGCEIVYKDEKSPDYLFLRDVFVNEKKLDIDVCVAETVHSGKRVLVPLVVINQAEIIEAAQTYFEALKSNQTVY